MKWLIRLSSQGLLRLKVEMIFSLSFFYEEKIDGYFIFFVKISSFITCEAELQGVN